MSIFGAPSFYNPGDQAIYDSGLSFIPQSQFRLGDPRILIPGGITDTAAANILPPPPIVPVNQGDGGGSGGITSAANTTGTFDYEYDALGNLSNPDNVGLTDEEQEAINEMNNPGLNKVDMATIGSIALGFTNPITGILGLAFNRKRKEEKAAEAARQAGAIARDNAAGAKSGQAGTSEGGIDASGPGSGGGYNEGNRCFEPNTLIQMADGSEKKIKEIQLGDQTKGGEVTGVFQFKVTVDEIHDYKGVTVAGSHFVKEDGKFIMVQDSPISVKVDKIPVVYSLDTTGRRIFIKDIEFADYNGDGIAKGFLANAGVDLKGFDKEVLRQVENRLI